MSSMPPDNGDPDDIDAIYRRWSAADTARPSSDTATRILTHAAAIAGEFKQRSAQQRSTRRHRRAAFAGLAAAAFAGLWVTPLFFRSHPAAVITVEIKPVPAIAPAPTPAPPPNLDAAARQSTAPAAKDTVARLARSRESSAPAAAGAAAEPLQSPPSSKTSAAKGLNAELADEGSLTAGNRGEVPMVSEAQRVERGVALRRAATVGDDSGVSALLEEPIDINARDSDGRTALLLAVAGGREGVVVLLLAHGADPNASDAYGETPLHAALTAGHLQIEAALKRAGAR